jgi:hypothetical protein
MWLVRAGTKILIYAPHGKLNGRRTIYADGMSMFDHNPYKPYVTNEDHYYHPIQVRTPSQIACGKTDLPEYAYHDTILDNKFIVMNRNNKGRRCYALVNTEDISFDEKAEIPTK